MTNRMIRSARLRSLSESEQKLWEEMTRDVRRNKKRDFGLPASKADRHPVSGLIETLGHGAAKSPESAQAEAPLTTVKSKPKSVSANSLPKPPPLSPIDHKTERQIKRGGVEIDARIDLHGLYQEAAHRRLTQFVLDASANGARVVLVITGKGKALSENGTGWKGDAGVLRRLTPLWLGEPALRPFVIGFGTAARHHGGDGALYVRIRQKQRLRTGGGLK